MKTKSELCGICKGWLCVYCGKQHSDKKKCKTNRE